MTGDRANPSQAAPRGPDDPPPPLAPRGLKAAVMIMGLLLIGGFMALFSAIVYRAVKPGPGAVSEVAGFGEIEALIGEDAEIGAIGLDGDRLAVQIRGPGGPEIILFDLSRGRELGRIRLRPE
ncbi:MAG: hypothetical protein Q8P46_13365 [Hyphomicrobiales bacterium]|nr:hypothetical protein [Hyphomicrobiales bacterium]